MSLLDKVDTATVTYPPRTPEYEAEVMAWRKALPDFIVRSLAYDYLRANLSEDCRDAYLEYQHRFGDENKKKRPRKEFSSRKRSSIKRRN